MNESQMVALALEAHAVAALSRWEQDGQVDCGSCGGYMLGYRGNSKLAKAMLAADVGFSMDGKVYLSAKLPESIRSQNAQIEIDAAKAFRSAVIMAGGPEPSKEWSYVD